MTRKVNKRYPHSNRADFADIAVCPICTQNKPVEDFNPREILHIEAHLQRPVIDLEIEGETWFHTNPRDKP